MIPVEHEIYIVLTQTGTTVSRALRYCTGKPYNHSSLAFDPALREMYSFARRCLHCCLIGGMVREDPETFVFARYPNTGCAVYRVRLSEEQYQAARDVLNIYLANFRRYRYDVIGLPLRAAGMLLSRPYRRVCSEFVADVLQKAGVATFKQDIRLVEPCDLAAIPGAELIYEGTLRGYDRGRCLTALPQTTAPMAAS